MKINFLNKNVFEVPEAPKRVPEKKVPVPVPKKPEPPPAKGISLLITKHGDDTSCFCTFIVGI